MLVIFSVSCNNSHYFGLKWAVKQTHRHSICIVTSVEKAWCKRLLSGCPSIKLFSTCWEQLLMTVLKVLPDGLTSNITFILNTHHVRRAHTCSRRQTASPVMKDLGVNIQENPSAVHLSSTPISWLQSLFSTSSTESSTLCLLFLIGPVPPLTRPSVAAGTL